MSDIGKNGYSYTGYSEPFIVPPGQTVTETGILSDKDIGVNGITGAVDVNYTEFKNSGLYIRSNVTVSGVTSFESKDLNFDTRMETGAGSFIISDDYKEGVVGMDMSNNVTVDDISYNNSTGIYTITVSGSINVISGKVYRVIARKIDTGDAVVPSGGFTEGQKVVIPVTPIP